MELRTRQGCDYAQNVSKWTLVFTVVVIAVVILAVAWHHRTRPILTETSARIAPAPAEVVFVPTPAEPVVVAMKKEVVPAPTPKLSAADERLLKAGYSLETIPVKVK